MLLDNYSNNPGESLLMFHSIIVPQLAHENHTFFLNIYFALQGLLEFNGVTLLIQCAAMQLLHSLARK